MRKVYIDEDPNIEEKFFCPKCAENNKQKHVRYMFINMDEAIFKCEGDDCMFPYKNFKFKDYSNNTVYRYVKDCEYVEECPNMSALESNMELLCATDTTLESIILETSNTSSLDLKVIDTNSLALDEDFLIDLISGIGQPKEDIRMAKIDSPPKILKKSMKLLESAKNAHIFKIPPLPGQASSPRRKPKFRRKGTKVTLNKICEAEVPKYEKVKPLKLVKEISLLKSNKHQSEEEKAAKTEQIKRFMNFIDRSLKKDRRVPSVKCSPPKRRCPKIPDKPVLQNEEIQPATTDMAPMKSLPDLF